MDPDKITPEALRKITEESIGAERLKQAKELVDKIKVIAVERAKQCSWIVRIGPRQIPELIDGNFGRVLESLLVEQGFTATFKEARSHHTETVFSDLNELAISWNRI